MIGVETIRKECVDKKLWRHTWQTVAANGRYQVRNESLGAHQVPGGLGFMEENC